MHTALSVQKCTLYGASCLPCRRGTGISCGNVFRFFRPTGTVLRTCASMLEQPCTGNLSRSSSSNLRMDIDVCRHPHRIAIRPGTCLLLLLVSSLSLAQRGAMTLAYQLTHVDTGEPFPSADGKKIVFEIRIAGVYQLFVMNPDGSGQVQITRDAANHDTPAWSPDGRKIAYVSDKGGHSVIYTINPDGTGEERVTDDKHEYIHPSWSGDSTKIIYCSDDDLKPPAKNASEIFSSDLKTKQVTTLVSGGTNTYPSWSPDGKKIVFRRMLGEMNSEVFVANGDGSEARNLSNHPAFDGWPAWSPDGTQIAFGSNRNANYQIWIMNADGTNVRLLANTEGRATEPRWAPDGKTIYFTNCKKVDWGVDCQVFRAQVEQTIPSRP
jgi:TolB protein